MTSETSSFHMVSNMLGNLSQTSIYRTTHKFFNDNQLLSESSLSIPVECLSEKSFRSIVKALIEELLSAKSRIIELEHQQPSSTRVHQFQTLGKIDSKNQTNADKLNKPKKIKRSKEEPILQGGSRETTTKSRKTSDNDKFCGQLHKRGKTHCPANGNKCRRCKKLNHFSSTCKTKIEKGLYGSNTQKLSSTISLEDLKKSKSEPDLKKYDLQTRKTVKDWRLNESLGQSSKTSHVQVNKDIPCNFGIKALQKNETEANHQPCLWCSRMTKYRCTKCAKVYCSRRCTFSDATHMDSCNFAYFCAHCAENRGDCNIHTSTNSEPKESEQEAKDDPASKSNKDEKCCVDSKVNTDSAEDDDLRWIYSYWSQQ